MAQQANLQAATRTTPARAPPAASAGRARSRRHLRPRPAAPRRSRRHVGAQQDAGRHQRRAPRSSTWPSTAGPRSRRSSARSSGIRSARRRSSTSTSTRSGPTRRSPLEVPVQLVGIPDGVRNFGGVLDHVLRELEIEVLPADIPEHIELDVTALDHRALALRARHQGRQGRHPQRSRHADLHGRGAADRRGAGRGRGGRRDRPSRSSSASPRPRPKARARPTEGLSPARHRGAGQSRPGVRRRPGTTPGFGWPTTWPRVGGWAAFAGASGPGWPKGAGTARPVQRAQAPDLHEPQRRGARRRCSRFRSSIPRATC